MPRKVLTTVGPPPREEQAVQIEVTLPVAQRRRATRGQAGSAPPQECHPRIPRITRLMALSIKFHEMVIRGEVQDYADLARLGYVILFSTDTGDAWLLEVTDQLAARLARDGDPEPISLEETDTSFAIEWKGYYRIEGSVFVYSDRDTGRVTTILGYPTQKIAQAG